MDATQRVVVFTTDISLAEIERKKESSSMEIFLRLRGVEVSIINNVNLEVATISLKDSPASWSLESTDTNELKTFTNDYCEWLERSYLKYLNDKSFIKMSTIDSIVSLSSLDEESEESKRVEIDFKNMSLLRPERGRLRRDWAPGLDIQYRTSANMTSLKCRVYDFQVRADCG